MTQSRHSVEYDGRCRPNDARYAEAAVADRDGLDCLSHRSAALASCWTAGLCVLIERAPQQVEPTVPPEGLGSVLGASAAPPPPGCGW
jgi:hypothetical protein